MYEQGRIPDIVRNPEELGISKIILNGGEVWGVGKRIGAGRHGSVFELVPPDEKPRQRYLLKLFSLPDRPTVDPGKNADGIPKTNPVWRTLTAEIHGLGLTKRLVRTRILRRYDDPGRKRRIVIAVIFQEVRGKSLHEISEKQDAKELNQHAYRKNLYEMFLPKRGKRFGPWLDYARALSGVLTSIADLHDLGYLHRDVNPKNIVLDPDNAEMSSIIDFSFLCPRRSPEERTQKVTMLQGTPYYIFPETLQGYRRDEEAGDIWGAILSFAGALQIVLFREREFSFFDDDKEEMLRDSINGKLLLCPNFSNNAVQAHLLVGIPEAAQDFSLFLYDFLCPTSTPEQRHAHWRNIGLLTIESRLDREEVRRRLNRIITNAEQSTHPPGNDTRPRRG